MKRFAALTLVVLLALAMAACSADGTNDATQDDTDADGGGTSAPEWVKVFTWKSGNKGNFTRNSKKFTLEGGDQRVDMVVKEVKGQWSAPSADWAMIGETDGDYFGTTKANDSANLYLDAGEYYVGGNTVDCYWTLTVYEKR